MILHTKDGIKGRVWDEETGREVRRVIWFDTERGILEAYQTDERTGKVKRDAGGNYLTVTLAGRFRFVPAALTPGRKVVMGAPKCARCPSVLTLPGDDLCPVCRAADRGQRNRMKVERLTTPFLNCKCQRCSRLAVIAVADEVQTTPEVAVAGGVEGLGITPGAKMMFDRGATVGRRYYCQRCYQAPRLLDAKGEVVADLEDGKGPELKRINNE